MSVIPQHSIKFYSHFSPSKLFSNKHTIFEHKIIYNKLNSNTLKYKYRIFKNNIYIKLILDLI
ncbi:hypothetical protein XBKB1_2490004 [Xenorhabdus bovienii str. kraussei Becker Underwood]|uniref:Uncharacterized protein n=1 Tax=Xenorhabdus bovienii str. kraussei Becker Underwood TaxID=1398204 RepID=A0A077PT53_XENBV|nr:hypothetical protein XBKB1_2490004 [Xenorhabdus bovienii str. kraussei Becker Underwood]